MPWNSHNPVTDDSHNNQYQLVNLATSHCLTTGLPRAGATYTPPRALYGAPVLFFFPNFFTQHHIPTIHSSSVQVES